MGFVFLDEARPFFGICEEQRMTNRRNFGIFVLVLISVYKVLQGFGAGQNRTFRSPDK